MRRAVLVALLLCAAACGPDDSCTRHSDCRANQICTSRGACELPPDAAPEADAAPAGAKERK